MTYGNEIHRGATEWPLWLTHQKWPAGGAILNAKAFLAHNSHIICCTLWNLISVCSLNSAQWCAVGHTHYHRNFPFANSWQRKKLLFQTPPRWFDRFAPNFAWSMCGPSWQKVIKRILIVHKMPEMSNNSFLHIVLKTNNLAYLYKILSDYHINVHNCVVRTDEGFSKIWCKSANRWHSGRSLIYIFVRWDVKTTSLKLLGFWRVLQSLVLGMHRKFSTRLGLSLRLILKFAEPPRKTCLHSAWAAWSWWHLWFFLA